MRQDPPLSAPDAALVAALRDDADLDAPFGLEDLATLAGTSLVVLESVARSGLLVPHHVDTDGSAWFSEADLAAVRSGLVLLEAGLPLDELLAIAVTSDASISAIAERASEAFLAFVRDPVLGSASDDDVAAQRLVTAYERMLPATIHLVAHHLRRRLMVAALQRLQDGSTEADDATDHG